MAVLLWLSLFALTAFSAGCGQDGAAERPSPDADAATGAVSHEIARSGQLRYEQIAGSQACQECHPEVFADWQQTGHANTFGPAHDVPFLDRLDGFRFHDPVRDVTLQYHVAGDQVDVSIPAVFGADRFPLQYAFGSGTHAISFLTLLPDVKGGTLGLEHRVSWYAEAETFALTPKHDELEAVQESEMFGRIVHRDIVGGCIACHVTAFEVRDQEVVNLEPDVGCESCHGAGRDHIAAIEQGLADLKIGFSRGSWKPRDEIRICGRCHRTTDDVPAEVIRPDEPGILRFQSVGLVQSRCYQQSGQRLSCTTCHNPHHTAASPGIEAYESKCLQCHGGQSASPGASAVKAEQVVCPESAQTGCIECHMPAVQAEEHVHFHDHWIRVRGDDDLPARPASSG